MPLRKILELEDELERQVKSLEEMLNKLHERTRELMRDERFYRRENSQPVENKEP